MKYIREESNANHKSLSVDKIKKRNNSRSISNGNRQLNLNNGETQTLKDVHNYDSGIGNDSRERKNYGYRD